MRLDVAGVDGPALAAPHVQHGFVDVWVEHERELLQPLDDLVHVLDHAGDRLMLVHHAVEAERPDGRPAQRRQQHAAQRIAEGVAVAALQWLQAELGGVRIVFPLGHFDQMRAYQPGQIESRHHLE